MHIHSTNCSAQQAGPGQKTNKKIKKELADFSITPMLWHITPTVSLNRVHRLSILVQGFATSLAEVPSWVATRNNHQHHQVVYMGEMRQ